MRLGNDLHNSELEETLIEPTASGDDDRTTITPIVGGYIQ